MGFSWGRLISWVVALLAGAVYGVAGTIAHSYRIGPVPVGLVLAIVGSGALLIAARLLTGDRWAAVACGVGLFVATLLFTGSGPGGSVIVPSGKLDQLGPVNLGTVWTISVPIMVVIAAVWPDTSRNRTPAAN